MEEKYLYQLAEFVLPSDVLHYFSIVKIESDTSLLRIYLDEKMEKELSDDLHFESKGFMEAVEVTDFPIRDHKVILVLRRRRWIDIRTGKSFSLPLQIDITASGTRYSKVLLFDKNKLKALYLFIHRCCSRFTYPWAWFSVLNCKHYKMCLF